MIYHWCGSSKNDRKESDKSFDFMKKKRLPFFALIWIILPVFVLPDAMGQSPRNGAQITLPPGVEIHIKATPEVATVGDPIRIDLEVIMPSGYRVEIPRLDTQIGDFTILDFIPEPAAPDIGKSEKPATPSPPQPGVSQHYRAQILAAIYKSGKFTFPPIQMKLTAANGKEVALSSTPANVEIRSVLSDKNPGLMDLKKQAEIPERRGWIIWLVIAAVLVIGAIIWIIHRQKPMHTTPLSPAQVRNLMDLAEADLRALLACGLPGNGSEKQFYVLISEIAKRILETGYEIHAAERTTSEIINSLSGRPDMESGKIEFIESFLFRCDAVKFAKYAPSMVEHEAASNDALQILAEAKKAVGSRQAAASGTGAS
jgi:hypothetical protein